MSIRQCRAVKAIVDHGSFAAAARALNVAPSAISMQVTSFEEAHGVTIFDRAHRPPRLTEAGRLMIEHARVVVEEYDRMADALAGGFARGRTMRIGVIPTALASELPAALMCLRALPHAPALRITSALTDELLGEVERGALDAALVHAPGQLSPGLAWREVAQQEVVVMAPPDTQQQTLPALFAAHPYIRFNRAARIAPVIERRLEALGIEPDVHAELQSVEAIRTLVNLGFGVSAVPIPVGPARGEPVRTLPLGEGGLARTIGFVMREDLAARQIAAVLVDAFVAACARLGA